MALSRRDFLKSSAAASAAAAVGMSIPASMQQLQMKLKVVGDGIRQHVDSVVLVVVS